MRTERDGWVLVLARYPDQGLRWLEDKRADFADPEFQRLYQGYDQAREWDPADPRLEELADAIARYVVERYDEDVALKWDLDDPTVLALLASHFGNASSPALERLHKLTEDKRARNDVTRH